MKKLFRPLMILLILLSLSLNISCDILTPIDPELKDQHEAYYTIVEAHALKQLWMYQFFQTFSNNYRRGQLFVYEPTSAQLEHLMDEFSVLMTYADAVEAAVDTLETLQNDPVSASFGKSALPSGLISSMYDFFTAGSQVGKNNRDRILLIASNMAQTDRDALYNKLGREFNGQFSDSDDFWVKLQNGELDKVASNIYRDFYDEDGGINNSFGDLARDKNLTPGKIVVKDGSMLIKKGGTVIIEAVKTIAPPLGAGIDLVESGKKWYEKGEKMVDKPLKFVADEIKSRTAAKIAGMVDVDGLVDHAGISEGLANSAKVLMEVSIGTSDSQELVEKGIDWGVAKLSSPDKSITPEVIVAENKNPSAGLPEYIFGVGNFVNQAGETLMTLPEGDWDITPRDKHGNTNKEPAVKIEAQKETEVICENDDDKADSLHLALHNFNKISISISSGSSIGGGFNVLNAIDSTYALKWAGKTFSAEFEKTFDTSTPNQSSYNIESIDFEGIISIASYDQLEVTVSGTYIYERYINDILISRRITRIDGIAVPAAFSRKDSYGNMWSYFIINPVYNSELLPSLSTYLDFEYHSTSYYSAGDNAGEFRSEIIYNTIENPLDGYIDIRFGYTDYKVISDY